MTINAHALIEALKQAGLPVQGLTIYDVDDPSTWTFDGLPDTQLEAAVAVVRRELLLAEREPLAVTQRRLWQLFMPEEYVALAKTTNASVVRLKAVVRAAESFDPAEAWVPQFFKACVDAGVLSETRADEIAVAINQPV